MAQSFTQWTPQENAWLQEQYRRKTPLNVICRTLERYPDDVALQLVTELGIECEEIPGFENAAHMELWREQQAAMQNHPVFALRIEIRRLRAERELQDNIQRLLVDKMK